MIKKILALLSVAALLILIAGCKGDKGPAGPSGTAQCFQCHADTTTIVTARLAEWSNSVHASGNNIDRNFPPCSGCHTGNGFVQKLNTGDPGTQVTPTTIDCFTCHAPHTNFNFNLRTNSAVTLMAGGTFDHGNGNLCANCHQARAASPPVNPNGNTVIKSVRWGPHHSEQGNTFAGQSAFVFAGASYGNSAHPTVITNGCPTCHMFDPVGDKAGGHTWNMTFFSEGAEEDFVEPCNQTGCHSGVTDFNLRGVQDSVETLLATLKADLISAGILDTTDLPRVPTGDSLVLAPNRAGALYNYLFFEGDRSMGIHNTRYTWDALNASIVALGSRRIVF